LTRCGKMCPNEGLVKGPKGGTDEDGRLQVLKSSERGKRKKKEGIAVSTKRGGEP